MSQSLLNIEGVLSASIDAGIKNNDALDLSIIYLTESTTTAAVFTQNVFCAAPVVIAKNHLNHQPKALLINSGNANAGT
ncbi:MAG: bifunctional ornithine acetyltransferase/N-acetylglutamate synthase, partial [Candidatus Thioglobus sp.]